MGVLCVCCVVCGWVCVGERQGEGGVHPRKHVHVIPSLFLSLSLFLSPLL